MLTIKTDPIKGAILRIMINAARSLNEADWPAGLRNENPSSEYARGQAELICDTLQLEEMSEIRDDLIRVITVPDPITIITR